METPFIFGDIAKNQQFIGYKDEIEALVSSFVSSKNVVVTAARKSGKTSLLEKAISKAQETCPELRICRISLANVRDEHLFFTLLAQQTIKALCSTWEEAASIVREYFSGMDVRMSMDTGRLSDMKLSFDRRDTSSLHETFWRMPESLAEQKKVKMTVIIDDFSNILNFKECDALFEEIFSEWKEGRKVAYCLAGSHRALMLERFEAKAAADAGFGNIISLGQINEGDLIEFIKAEFARTSKYIDDDAGKMIIRLAGSHPYYIQQLSQISWLRTYVVCTIDIVKEAYEALLNQMDMVFGALTDTLTDQQLCYVKAIVSGERIVSTADVLHRYGISSATSASRSKTALLQRDIIDIHDGYPVIQDPIYSAWIKKRHFLI